MILEDLMVSRHDLSLQQALEAGIRGPHAQSLGGLKLQELGVGHCCDPLLVIVFH